MILISIDDAKKSIEGYDPNKAEVFHNFYRTHAGSRKILLYVAENFPNIEILLYESSYNKVQELIYKKLKFGLKGNQIEFLRKNQYTENEVLNLVKVL
jgi:hypothetical protein